MIESRIAETEQEESFKLPEGDIVCKEGVSFSFYEQIKPWLDAKEGRRLFWLENNPERLARVIEKESALPLLNDLRTRIFFIQYSLEEELATKVIGWMSLFKELIFFGERWKGKIESVKKAAELIASDAADFGVAVARHLKANFTSPMRSLASLRGSMKNTPAIIIGAGPSLEKNGHLLRGLQDKALLIAAGTAIKAVNVRPDLAVALDPHEPVERTRYFDVPLCLQGRAHPKTRKGIKGELIYFPDSHFAFESWLTGAGSFNSGWTVGNAAVSIAIELGCNPIVLVGMDYCYRGKQKYAGGKRQAENSSLVSALDGSGQEILTQPDWLMAISWMQEIAEAHPEISFINATEDGMLIGSPFKSFPLADIRSDAFGVSERWKMAVNSSLSIELSQQRLQDWKESLARSKSAESETIQEDKAVDELAYKLLLEPLWQIWAPMFERELMVDPHPIPMAKKLTIQKHLFFNQVISEHLNVW